MSPEPAQLLQRVCCSSSQPSCLKKLSTTYMAARRSWSLITAKSPHWMESGHRIPLFPQLPLKPAWARVKNSTATCALPRVSPTWIGTGTCRREQACAPAWLVCCRFRLCNQRGKFLSLWKKCHRYEIKRRLH